jgi:predicted GTPase
VLIISKCGSAAAGAVDGIRERASRYNPDAMICRSDLRIEVEDAERLVGQRVLVIEDGPTVTHGGMAFGAGMVAAERYGAIPVDPRPYAVGTIQDTFEANPHLERVLPAMGYSQTQREALAATINACCAAEKVSFLLDASPARLDRMMDLDVPLIRVAYRFVQLDGPPLEERVMRLLE